MKLKKLFAGVVAAAMIATMSFPAFAAESNLKDGKIELTKNLYGSQSGNHFSGRRFHVYDYSWCNGKR